MASTKIITTIKKGDLKVSKKSNYGNLNKINLKQDTIIKNLIWCYFFLIIFENALRKWLLPGLATPLLLIRDPIAIILIFKTWKYNQFPKTIYLIGIVAIGFISIFTAIFMGHGNLAVALYGARIFLLHFPLIFIIGRFFSLTDVIKVGKITMIISILMTIVLVFQFYSPQSAWINRGVGGDEAGAGFSGAMGFFRPSGTFSFTNGVTLFYSLLAPFVLYFWLNPKLISRGLLIISTACLFSAIPLSISRGLFFQVGLCLIFSLAIIFRKPKYFGKMLIAAIGFTIALICLNEFKFFSIAISAFTSRFDVASEQEGGLKGSLGDRYLGGLIGAIRNSSEQPFFGVGVGMGTNVGSMLLTGKQEFLVDEGEWGRLVGELGPLMGLAVIAFRLGLSIKLTIASYYKMVNSNFLPWLLLSLTLTAFPQGQWAQPTALGFSILSAGLVIASLKGNEKSIS